MASEWQPLPVILGENEPPLLIKHKFESDKYSLHVTDLCHVWSESLGRRSIIERARDIRCSIDPQDGASQIEMLLEKIKAAFRGGEESSLTTAWDANGDDLTIKSVSSLPKPLSPLRWAMHLKRMSDTEMRAQLILPLIDVAYVQNQQIDELASLLREKDNAISKIVDKVESLGLDLSSVFPQAGAARFSKKKSQRDHIFKQVRGLATFHREVWSSESLSALQSTSLPSLSQMAQVVFAGAGRSMERNSSLDGSTTSGEARSAVLLAQRPRATQKEPSQQESQPDGFQHQDMPPEIKVTGDTNLTQTKARADDESMTDVKKEIVDDDTTEDEDEGEVNADAKAKARGNGIRNNGALASEHTGSTERPIPPEPIAVHVPSPRKIGLVGKTKWMQPAEETDKSQVQGRQAPHTGVVEMQVSPRRSPVKEPKQTLVKPAPRKLGKIGGRKTKVDEASAPSSSAAESTTNSKLPGTSPSARGSLDMHRVAEDPHPTVETKETTRERESVARQEAPSTPPPEESAQARADRKRTELKREMAEKNRVGPKKKRKF